MKDEQRPGIPESPETQPPAVRDELDQMLVSHEGAPRQSGDGAGSQRMGAVETEVTPVMPPMTGPSRLTRPESEDDPEIDPRDEIPGG